MIQKKLEANKADSDQWSGELRKLTSVAKKVELNILELIRVAVASIKNEEQKIMNPPNTESQVKL